MPNGGQDDYAACGFNRFNEGRWGLIRNRVALARSVIPKFRFHTGPIAIS
jgi:hypothetical protein